MVEALLPRLFRFFDHGFFANDHYDAGFSDVVALAVGFQVVADFGALGNGHVAVDDGVAHAGVPPDVDVIEQDRVLHVRVAVCADVVAQHGAVHAAAGNDRASAHHGIEANAHAVGIGEDGLDRKSTRLN